MEENREAEVELAIHLVETTQIIPLFPPPTDLFTEDILGRNRTKWNWTLQEF